MRATPPPSPREGACDWKGLPEPISGEPYQNLTSPRTSTPGGLTYYGMTSSAAMPDTPLDFFFTGPFSFDFEVLFQLSAWDNTVEFGTYEAGQPEQPDADSPQCRGAAGPYSNNRGAIETSGSGNPTGDFGFYYRNTRYGATPDTEILFFTESRFNRIGHYFGYFSDPKLWACGMQTPTRFGGDDEQGEAHFVDFANAVNRQQFALFHEGGRYWLGLEDQMGDVTSAFCWDRGVQPCSDYDHNDLIISFTERSCPAAARSRAHDTDAARWRCARRDGPASPSAAPQLTAPVAWCSSPAGLRDQPGRWCVCRFCRRLARGCSKLTGPSVFLEIAVAYLRLLFVALLAVLLPGTATAASLVFEGAPGQAAAWKPVTGATGDGTLGYWDCTSYDSAGTRGPGACSAAALVIGRPCDWIPNPTPPLENPSAGDTGRVLRPAGPLAGGRIAHRWTSTSLAPSSWTGRSSSS